jgi:hypothetical protein
MFHESYKIWLLAGCLVLCAALRAAPPNWSVTPAQFQYSMSFNAQVVLNGAKVQTGANLVGAFVGGQCRGVGTPMTVNGQAYYFFNVYSNLTSGENVTFQYYNAANDQLYTAVQTTTFVRNSVVGDVMTPYLLSFVTGNDYPISLLPIPDRFTVVGQPTVTFDLGPYLQSIDHDPVVWTAVTGVNLTATINGSMLTLTSKVFDWLGSDTVRITVKETGTVAGYSAVRTFRFTIAPDYQFTLDNLPTQIIAPGGVFPGFDLDDYLVYGGVCRQFSYEMMPFDGVAQAPVWNVAPPGNGTMTVICKVRFGTPELATPGCKLAAFIGGQLRGVAGPTLSGGSYWYFLVVNNGAAGAIDFKFYDAGRHFLYDSPSALNFAPNTTAGTVSQPQIIQLAPLDVQVTSDGQVTAPIRDPSWRGTQKVQIIAWDCDFPQTKRDTGCAFFKIDAAYGGAPFIYTPSAVDFTDKSCGVLYDAGTFDNVNSEGNGLTYSISGGDDRLKFALDPVTGILSWLNFTPDYAHPADANTDNIYEVEIKVVDQAGLFDKRLVKVKVTMIANIVPGVDPVSNRVECGYALTAPVFFKGNLSGTMFNWANSTPSIGLPGSGTGDIAPFLAVNFGLAPVVATITVTPVFTQCGWSYSGPPTSFTMTVKPAPLVNAVANQLLCINNGSAPVSFSSALPGTSFKWTNSTPSIGLGPSGMGDIPSFVAGNSGVGVVTVVPMANNGCTGPPYSFLFVVF